MNERDNPEVAVRISDFRHPHFYETGRLTGHIKIVLGAPMAEVKLDACEHGAERCFVRKGQVRRLPARG